MTDQQKKSLRSFTCRDYLWDVFQRMSVDLQCSVDYLINEAMRQYVQNQQGAPPPQFPPGQSLPPAPPGGAAVPFRSAPLSNPPGQSRPNAAAHLSSVPPPVPAGFGAPPPRAAAPPAPLKPPTFPGAPRQAGPTGPMQPVFPGAQPTPAAPSPVAGAEPRFSGQPQRPARPAQPAAAATARPPLFIIFNGQKIPITKDEFVIGRGSKLADLAIKDGNISRRHAAVTFQGGAYYIRDLGSTNGIEYGGRRIDSKRIEEGDTFRICDYELRCTYH